jgi:threonine synthase
MSLWSFASLLPPIAEQFRITLGEGHTPLVRSRKIGPRIGLPNLYFKLEFANPTGSYKDRFAALAISHMWEHAQKLCLATSSGNTGAALAAYCASAGLNCEIAVVEGAPEGKLAQMRLYGANIYRVRGFGADAVVTSAVMNSLRDREARGEGNMQISAYCLSPVGMAGVQSISYELAEANNPPMNHVFCPAGGGGLTLAVARGFAQLVDTGKLEASPRIECAQPAGNDTIASALQQGRAQANSVVCTSQISGLQVANVLDGNDVIGACRASGGGGHVVTDEEIWAAQAMLAREEGLWTEPAGAVALAAVLKARSEQRLKSDAAVACLLTGGGWKDEVSTRRIIGDQAVATIDAGARKGV